MPKYKDKSTFSYPADLVWAAACAAYRVNNGYVKTPEINDQGKITRPTNRELVRLYLEDTSYQHITELDLQQGSRCRQDLLNSATMAALKNRATEWSLLTAKMATLEQVNTDYEVSVIASMPKNHAQNLARESTDSRLAYCESDSIGQLNERIETVGEVVRCNYSAKYRTNYVTVITDSNHQVFFAYRESLALNQKITVCGRVKRHADRATQLSRVKIIEQRVI
jgi:hypothetical protein